MASAQQKFQPEYLSIGYFAPLGIDLGLKASVTFELGKTITNTMVIPTRTGFYAGGQVAYYFRKNFYQSSLFNTEIGWRRQRVRKKSYLAFALNNAYLLRFEALTLNVNFKGQTDVTEWEARHFYMPGLSYEAGRRINRRFHWYSKFTYGYAISTKHENTGILFLEAGIHYFFNK
jgi:hypothetical protein